MSTIIRSESEFLDFILNQPTLEALHNVRFDGWPEVNIYVKGDEKRYNCSLPTGMMEGIVDLQKSFNRAYSSVRYNNKNSKKLSSTEKKELEAVFKVKKGSTDASADASGLVNGLLDKADLVFKNMDGQQTLLTLVTIVLTTGGYLAYRHYQDKKTERHSMDELTRQLDVMRSQSNQSSEAMVKLADIVSNTVASHKMDAFSNTINKGYESVGRRVTDATEVKIGQAHFVDEALDQLKPSSKNEIQNKEMSMEIAIQGFRTKPDKRVFYVETTDSGHNFNMICDSYCPQSDIEKLIDASKTTQPVKVNFHGRLVNGILQEGRFVSFNDS